MKKKMLMIALATTVFLGGCYEAKRAHYHTDRNYHRSDMTYSHATYGVDGERLSYNDVRKVQRALAEQGYYKGSIDGIWGDQTSQAILNYQMTHQQSQTGMLTVGNLRDFGIQMDHDAYRSRYN